MLFHYFFFFIESTYSFCRLKYSLLDIVGSGLGFTAFGVGFTLPISFRPTVLPSPNTIVGPLFFGLAAIGFFEVVVVVRTLCGEVADFLGIGAGMPRRLAGAGFGFFITSSCPSS
jgi:hypothetical protein